MNALEFARKLGIGLELTRDKGKASLATYPDGHSAIRIPKKWDQGTEENQRCIWHEIGHFIDQARHRGGHSQMTSWAQYGRFSSDYWKLLKDNQEYLQSDRVPIEVVFSISYHRKHYKNLDELNTDPDVPATIKERFRIAVGTKAIKYKHMVKNYLNQTTEIFADGFAKYMLDRNSMLKEHPDLAALFELASRNPSKEELDDDVEPRTEWLTPVLPDYSTSLRKVRKRNEHGAVPSGFGGLR